MKTVAEYRREILKKWIAEVGKRTKAARLTEIDPYNISYAYLGQLIADPDKKGSRNIGDAVAEKLELAFGKPKLSMTPQTGRLSAITDDMEAQIAGSDMDILSDIQKLFNNLSDEDKARAKDYLLRLQPLPDKEYKVKLKSDRDKRNNDQ